MSDKMEVRINIETISGIRDTLLAAEAEGKDIGLAGKLGIALMSEILEEAPGMTEQDAFRRIMSAITRSVAMAVTIVEACPSDRDATKEDQEFVNNEIARVFGRELARGLQELLELSEAAQERAQEGEVNELTQPCPHRTQPCPSPPANCLQPATATSRSGPRGSSWRYLTPARTGLKKRSTAARRTTT